MSAVAQTVYGYPRPQATTRPGLRAVARPRARVNVTTVTMLVTALIAIVVVRMFIYVAVESSAYEIASLHKQNVGLSRDAQFLQEQLNVLDSPQNLAAMAAELGMVSNSSPTYIQLSDGQVWEAASRQKPRQRRLHRLLMTSSERTEKRRALRAWQRSQWQQLRHNRKARRRHRQRVSRRLPRTKPTRQGVNG